ncbi:hypothetical protein NECID01_1174 [Nematocida sp. AWRm77]|nr:hypothetical protein NECID01_1174 [Nematocida sp. AWRm77]
MGLVVSKCLNRKKRSVIFIGPPGCGKTSIIKLLKKDKTDTEGSTTLYEQSTVLGKGYALNIFDLSGDQKQSQFWKFYTENCHLVVFVVDISTEEKILTAKTAFKEFYTSYCIHKESLVFLLNKKTELSEEKGAEHTQIFHREFESAFGMSKNLSLKAFEVDMSTERSKLLSFICRALQ